MPHTITILGAGVVGLWQALRLAQSGHSVQLFETSAEPFADAASAYAGTMLAPDCEFPAVQQEARTLARQGLRQWMDAFECVIQNGSLVVANDRAELEDLAHQSEQFRHVGRQEIADLEPALGTRHAHGLYFAHEAHMETKPALDALLVAVQDAGAEVHFGASATDITKQNKSIIIDCRGLAAQDQLDTLRGVRGERIIVKTDSVHLTRPVRLLHLRQPIYVVPWANHRFMIGATTIESADQSAVSVKSALDLLAMAYQLHPAFGEAEILDFGASVRPAFPENLPRVIVRDSGRYIHVNGSYRHGFLLAPVLADMTAKFLDTGDQHAWMTIDAETCSTVKAL